MTYAEACAAYEGSRQNNNVCLALGDHGYECAQALETSPLCIIRERLSRGMRLERDERVARGWVLHMHWRHHR